jgi:hypothetical protein
VRFACAKALQKFILISQIKVDSRPSIASSSLHSQLSHHRGALLVGVNLDALVCLPLKRWMVTHAHNLTRLCQLMQKLCDLGLLFLVQRSVGFVEQQQRALHLFQINGDGSVVFLHFEAPRGLCEGKFSCDSYHGVHACMDGWMDPSFRF